MEATTISSKFQVVIPEKIRRQFKIKPGQKVLFIPVENTLRLIIIPSIEEAYGMFKGINTDDLREEVDEER